MEGAIKVLCVDSPQARTQAQAIQAMWKENLGLELPVVPMQVKMLIPMLIAGTFDCVVGGGRTAQTPDPAYMIDFVYDENKWDDARFRKMIEDSRVKTGDERLRILMEAEKYLLANYVYIPQVYAVQDYILNPKVQGFLLYPYGVQYDYKYISKVK
jgi:oligopeptide transport system substrate-binding protein